MPTYIEKQKKNKSKKVKRNVEFCSYGHGELNSKYYVNGRYGLFETIFVSFFSLQRSSFIPLVLPSDNSIIFGQKTLYHPKHERNLDWLYELEEVNRKESVYPENSEVDLCCCPFLKITSKSLKSKK